MRFEQVLGWYPSHFRRSHTRREKENVENMSRDGFLFQPRSLQCSGPFLATLSLGKSPHWHLGPSVKLNQKHLRTNRHLISRTNLFLQTPSSLMTSVKLKSRESVKYNLSTHSYKENLTSTSPEAGFHLLAHLLEVPNLLLIGNNNLRNHKAKQQQPNYKAK